MSRKRQVPQHAPEDPLVPVEYLLDLMGWKSRSTYYSRLARDEPLFPKPVPVGTRNVMLLRSECHAYQRSLLERRAAGREAPAGHGPLSAAGAEQS